MKYIWHIYVQFNLVGIQNFFCHKRFALQSTILQERKRSGIKKVCLVPIPNIIEKYCSYLVEPKKPPVIMKAGDVDFGPLAWFGAEKDDTSIYGPCFFKLDFQKNLTCLPEIQRRRIWKYLLHSWWNIDLYKRGYSHCHCLLWGGWDIQVIPNTTRWQQQIFQSPTTTEKHCKFLPSKKRQLEGTSTSALTDLPSVSSHKWAWWVLSQK